jgi:GAF domain-containing protein
MAENFVVATGDKRAKYELLYRQVEALVEGESDAIANMANVAAMIDATFHFWWTGFYRVVEGELILGPFQGPVACSRIAYGRGVCGTAWRERRSVVVEDVELFEGHIACSSASRSEIVVPIFHGDDVVAVLDIDSERLAMFDDMDREWLERIVALL